MIACRRLQSTGGLAHNWFGNADEDDLLTSIKGSSAVTYGRSLMMILLATGGIQLSQAERSKYCADRFMRENAKDSGDKRVDSRPKHEHEPAQLARMNWLSAILDRVRPFGWR